MLSLMAEQGWHGAEHRSVTKYGTASATELPPRQQCCKRRRCTHGYRHLGGESEWRGEMTDTDNVRLPLCAQKP